MKYILNKKIFYANLIIGIILVGSMIYLEGYKVIRSRTETITCPYDALTQCRFITPQGEYITLQKGEIITTNQFNQKRLNIANYGIWILITTSLITNHLIYNRKYPIKKTLRKLYKTIKQTEI